MRPPGETTQLKRKFGMDATPTAIIVRSNEIAAGRIVGGFPVDIYVGKLEAIINRL